MADENLPVVTTSRVQSVGRHVVTFSAGAGLAIAGVGAFLHSHGVAPGLVDQLQSISGGLKALADGLTTVFGAITAIVGGASVIYATVAAGPKAQAKSLISAVPGTGIVAPPALADKVEAVNSTADTKIVGR